MGKLDTLDRIFSEYIRRRDSDENGIGRCISCGKMVHWKEADCGRQSKKKLQNHVCPLQLDTVERLINRYTNPGDLVFDPFGGIGTVSYCAVKLERSGLYTELNPEYFRDSLPYQREAECNRTAPTLFDALAV